MSTTLTAADIAREGSIRRMAHDLRLEHLLENGPEQHRLWELMRERVLARSDVQVARMEQAARLESRHA